MSWRVIFDAAYGIGELPDVKSKEVLHRHRWLICSLLLIGVSWGLWHHLLLSTEGRLREAKLLGWKLALDAELKERREALTQLTPLANRAQIVALREGPNGTRAWITQLEKLFKEGEKSLGDLKTRVDGGLAMVKQGWWEAEGHFRLFHTHSRGSSPLVRICMPISVTTQNTKWRSLEEMLLVRTLLPSLLRTMEPGYLYGVYLGYDVGDPLLDKPGAEAQLHTMWKDRCASAGLSVELKLFRYNDTRHHNVWAVNYITKEAYLDGYDYFFRINDDSEFKQVGWTSRLVEALQLNEDFGAAGVLDAANPRIWTHSFVGRPHVEIFGFHFPFSFGNWWSDDWITFAYSHRFSFWLYDVDIHHHRHNPRYNINWNDYETKLRVEWERAQVRWKQWLCKVRDLAEFCSPLDPIQEAELAAIAWEADSRKGLHREKFIEMETKAREDQFVRMNKVKPKQTIKKP